MYSGLQGKSAVVTGASSGIGLAVAQQLAENDVYVVGLDINTDPRMGGPGFDDLVETGSLITGDVRNKDSIDSAFGAATKNGPVTIVVNNAGITSQGTLEEIDGEDLKRAFEVHMLGSFNMCKRAVPEMKAEETGSIVNVTSMAALIGWRASADYSSMKGAISSFTRQLAADYSPHGIRVNAVAPGFIKTALTADIWQDNEQADRDSDGDSSEDADMAAKNEAVEDAKVGERVDYDVAKRRTLLPYLGEPDHVAKVVTFLASEDAGFITGQVVPVDGGWTISSL